MNMKKLLSVLLALIIVFAFAGCSSDDEAETSASDESTSLSEESEDTGDDAGDEADTSSTSQNDTTEATAAGTTAAKTTAKSETSTTEKETTTKRKIKLNVKFPYYSGKTTTLKIEYKQSSDKSYKVLVEDEEITLDKTFTNSYNITEKLIGDVDVRITLDGIELYKSNFVVSGTQSESTIELATGVEQLDGGFD